MLPVALYVEVAIISIDPKLLPYSISTVVLNMLLLEQAEIDGRQKAISTLQKEVEQVPEKVKRVSQLSTTLDQAWLKRKQYLTQVCEV